MFGSLWKPFDTWPKSHREDKRRPALLSGPPSRIRKTLARGHGLLLLSEIEVASRNDGAPFQRLPTDAERLATQHQVAAAIDALQTPIQVPTNATLDYSRLPSGRPHWVTRDAFLSMDEASLKRCFDRQT